MTVATATPPRPTKADPEDIGQIGVNSIFLWGKMKKVKLPKYLEDPELRPVPPLHPPQLPRLGPEPTPAKAKTAPGRRGNASFSGSAVFSKKFHIYRT